MTLKRVESGIWKKRLEPASYTKIAPDQSRPGPQFAMNVKRGERLHPIILSLAHGAFRAETAGMKVSFTISAAASTARS